MKKKILLFLMAAVLVASCGTQKSVTGGSVPQTSDERVQQEQYLLKVVGTASKANALAAQVRYKLSYGEKSITLSGQLRMKRGEVIRLQLMALGIMEAGRIEFTPSYVLIMDRINKQYVKAPYSDVDFLRQNGVTFYSLQSLFWNELFTPGKQKMTQDDLQRFDLKTADNWLSIATRQGKLSYEWRAEAQTGHIRKADVVHEAASLHWTYADFETFAGRPFPASIDMRLQLPDKTAGIDMRLNSLSSESDWETLTQVSSKYKQVKAEDILNMLMKLAN